MFIQTVDDLLEAFTDLKSKRNVEDAQSLLEELFEQASRVSSVLFYHLTDFEEAERTIEDLETTVSETRFDVKNFQKKIKELKEGVPNQPEGDSVQTITNPIVR